MNIYLLKLKPISQEIGVIDEGEWKNGIMDGTGKFSMPDGSYYEGEWVEGKFPGRGKLVHLDGDVYDGELKDNEANGNGTYFYANGSIYQGEVFYMTIQWQNDYKHGFGVETWPNGAKYEGQYFEGKYDGFGILKFANGDIYEGEFLLDEINGKGRYIWLGEKKVYTGQWKKNKMCGRGQLLWEDGRKYSGEYFWRIKNMGKEYLIGMMAGNILELGLEVKNFSLFLGKQNGIGFYKLFNGQIKVREWKEGIRLRWFEETEISQLINEDKSNIENIIKLQFIDI